VHRSAKGRQRVATENPEGEPSLPCVQPRIRHADEGDVAACRVRC
jgi:hypothetical protein